MNSDSTEEWTSDSSHWELPAAESYVLVHGPAVGNLEPFKLALSELVARGILTLREVTEPAIFNRTRTVQVLVKGDHSPPDDGSLAAVYEAFRRAKSRRLEDGSTGVELEELALAASEQYRGIRNFAGEAVVPELERRGYYTARTAGPLGLFGKREVKLTPDGEAARQQIQSRIATGRTELGGWLRDHPDRATAFLASSGAAVLMMPFVFEQVADFEEVRAARPEAFADWSLLAAPGSSDLVPSREHDPGSTTWQEAFSMWGDGPTAFAALGNTISSMDAGLSSVAFDGGGFGGGDGGGFGGGDGGGGGFGGGGGDGGGGGGGGGGD